jgi:hypothetical protein
MVKTFEKTLGGTLWLFYKGDLDIILIETIMAH